MEYYFYIIGVLGNIITFLYILGRVGAVLAPIGVHYLFSGQLAFYGKWDSQKLSISFYFLFFSTIITFTLGKQILQCENSLILGAITSASLIIQLIIYYFFESLMENPYNFLIPIINFNTRSFSKNYNFHTEIITRKIEQVSVENKVPSFENQVLKGISDIQQKLIKSDEIIDNTHQTNSRVEELKISFENYMKSQNEKVSTDDDIFEIVPRLKFSFKTNAFEKINEIQEEYKIDESSTDALTSLLEQNKFIGKIFFQCVYKNKWVHARKICEFFLNYTDLFEQKSKTDKKITQKDIYETINKFASGSNGKTRVENPIKADAFGDFLKENNIQF